MGLAKSTNTSVFYRTSEYFSLRFKRIGPLLKQMQVVRWHIMKHSSDPTASAIYERRLSLDRKGHVGTGRKNSPFFEVELLESLVSLD